MVNSLFDEINTDLYRKVFLKYLRMAFQILPPLKNPRILDIGCGSGVPTLELAQLSGGEIIGIDIDQFLLDVLQRKIDERNLSSRVKARNVSLFQIDYPDESFDILWAEGAIAIIGFKKGLQAWRRLLKPKGYLVIHDVISNLSSKLAAIPRSGYILIDHFLLPEGAWWTEYYAVLEPHIKQLQSKYQHDPGALEQLQHHQKEIAMIKKTKNASHSVYIIMQKN